MDLGAFLLQVAVDYERSDGLNTPTQSMLKGASRHLREFVPPGMLVLGSGGRGMATYTPWVAWLDPDETESPQRGVYAVYLFTEDLEAVALTLNQGMEDLRARHGDTEARRLLKRDADAVRALLPEEWRSRWSDAIDLRSKGARQLAYQAGNIACRMYAVGSLPGEAVLRADLAEMLTVYADAVRIKRRLLLEQPGTVASSSSPQVTAGWNPLADFKPKSDQDYVALLGGRRLVKSRRHERLVNTYAAFCESNGMTPSSPHPEDLQLLAQGETFLVEVKVVRAGNATDAVREAVGQLLTYRHFLHPSDPNIRLVALFSESIGEGYETFLASLGIASVWWEEGKWCGNALSQHWKLPLGPVVNAEDAPAVFM